MKLIKQLDWFIKRQKRTYIFAIILLIITGIVDMLPPWILSLIHISEPTRRP